MGGGGRKLPIGTIADEFDDLKFIFGELFLPPLTLQHHSRGILPHQLSLHLLVWGRKERGRMNF